jgi:RNA polymerase sigma-70 factor (ECF subfamily)
VTLETAPPVIVKTVPQAGQTDVSADVSEIQVTFSKEMMDESWSWVQQDPETFPESGKPKYLPDRRTCVLPVRLAPGKTYVIWLNHQRYANFQDVSGRPAVPYLLTFSTSAQPLSPNRAAAPAFPPRYGGDAEIGVNAGGGGGGGGGGGFGGRAPAQTGGGGGGGFGGAPTQPAQPSAPSSMFLPLLNNHQQSVLAWTDRQFRSYFDNRSFAGWNDDERKQLETKLIDTLQGPQTREYYQAINTLGAMKSLAGLPTLRKIAYDRAEKNNRDRWMAIRALGILQQQEDVPELIHLIYHGNPNTRWWAQISLVRITGQNFAADWKAWGNWWNGQNGQPPYKDEIIQWWSGQGEPEKLAETLAEWDKKFLEKL